MEQVITKPEHYINRETSWLEFNKRVLEEAQDASQPLMERVKFLCIFSSNLDEFFEVRVAGIKQQIENRSANTGPDGMSPPEVFEAIRSRVLELIKEKYDCWSNELLPELAKNNIHFHDVASLDEEQKAWAKKYFIEEVYPVLTPLAVDASHPFPQLLNKSHNVIVKLRKPGTNEELQAIVQLPRVLPRLIRLPHTAGENRWDYIYLKSLIKFHVGELFPGLEVIGAHAFRITRNSDLYIDEEEAENLLRTIEDELKKRSRGNAVRLEVQEGCPQDVREYLLDNLNLKAEDLYTVHTPLNFQHLGPLWSDSAFARFRDRPFSPSYDLALPPEADTFQVMRREDVLLHHPYESFDSVVQLIENASRDPHVLAIKMTLYRTSGNSPIVKALMAASQNGKQVTALVELKARFDEANNIQWARQLEDAGCHVVYGVVGLKTHCKVMLIVRKDEDRIRRYVHLGTGNYHPSTARLYTDLSLFTTRKEITDEVATLFNTLTGLAEYPSFKRLMVAPFDLADRFHQMIDREIKHAKAGKPGRIIIKVNSLVDEEIIASMYEASTAGVKIDLIVRGICCLRPGIPGVSENIRVISIVGRFLEHSRIYYFDNNGKPDLYLGSADWMPRNFYRRVEVAFPVLDPKLLKQIEEEIIPAYLNDRVKARSLQPDGKYIRLKPEPGTKATQAQLTFREIARRQTDTATQKKSAANTPARLKPLMQPVKGVDQD